jgi:glucose/arabinose dehydrogenase
MRALLASVLLCVCAACSGQANPPGVSDPGGVIQIAGTERLGWSQPANGANNLSGYHFFLYIDGGSRAELPDVSCAQAGSAFDCAGRLPGLPAGTHSLTLAAAASDGIESAPSAPLRVLVVRAIVSGATSVNRGTSAATGQNGATPDAAAASGLHLNLQELATGLTDPTDLAVVPDGRVFVAERAGRVRVLDLSGLWSEPTLDLGEMDDQAGGGLLGIAVDPDFARSGFFYAVYTTSEGFRVVRFHEINQVFAERVVMLDGVAASPSPAAALRFGPDARLYVAFDDGGVAARAGDFGSYNGKVLRLNADGSVPSDQAGLTPVWATNLAAPRALDWTLGDGTLWAVEGGGARAGRLDAIVTEGLRSHRGKIASQFALPDRADPSGVVAYHGDLIKEWRGDLLISLAGTQQLLRLRLDTSRPNQVVQTERVINGEAGVIRALAVSPTGSVYLVNDRSLLELVPEP